MAETEYIPDSDESDGEAAPGLFTRLCGWYREDITHVNEWRKEAKEDFDFYSGHQWSDEDRNALKSQQRPALTFSRISPLVNAVVGSEINNRREVRFFQREEGDAIANEVLTAAAEWFRDECGAEDEETDAFKSNVIAGMGWTDTRLDFTEEPDGAPKVEDIDAFEMVWDKSSVKPNLADAQRIFRVREMDAKEATELTGEKDVEKLHASWAANSGPIEPHDQDEADQYSGSQVATSGLKRKKVTIVEARWLERELFYRGPDINDPNQEKQYSEDEYEQVNKAYSEARGEEFPAIKQYRKVVRRAFLGKQVLGEPDKPLVPPGMFGWECITGYKDKNLNQWYGIVRVAKDPQRWSNKFFSQVQFLLNSQSKGGIIAERGAFENDRQAEQSWSKSDAITWAQQGSLSGDKPKIMPKTPAQFPAGFFTLFQESKESINDVTGLSQEFIGTREVDQAGVLEHQRRQSSLNLLAELFNSLRRYRKRQGRVLLYLIQNHLANGRLVRIMGEGKAQYVRLLTAEGVAKAQQEGRQQLEAQAAQGIQQAVAQGIPIEEATAQAKQMVEAEYEKRFASLTPVDGEYDVIVDDAPNSPNEKERTWAIMLQMLPLMRDLITPDMIPDLLEMSPLSATLVEKMKRKAEEQAKQPKPPSPEEIKAQAAVQSHQMDMEGKQADIAAKQQENQMDIQMKGIDLMIKEREMELDALRDQQKLQFDMQRMAVQERQNAIATSRANSQRVSAAKQ